MLDRKGIIKKIDKFKDNFIGIKGTLKTLENRVNTLNLKRQQELLKNVVEATQAKEDRDRALSKLDVTSTNIDEFKEVCYRYNKKTDANKVDLIQEAERLLFDEEIINKNWEIDPQKNWMFTDQASIGRSLLDGN